MILSFKKHAVKPLIKVPSLLSSTAVSQNNESFEQIIQEFLTFVWLREIKQNIVVNRDPYITRLKKFSRKNLNHYASIYRINFLGERKLSTTIIIILNHFYNLASISVAEV